MAILKCKMCGGDLQTTEGVTVVECEYCATKQTVPTQKDEVLTNLFNRANNLRLKNEFDKAAEVYGKILNQDDSDAEAHWGMVLCKYGIEYVEDPKTYKRIPTCHRAQYTSVLSDADYLAAVENADAVSRDVYTAQAHEIAELQKSILAIVKGEKPFDVFICYKETDENGKRTVDSALANDIYYQLTKEGLRVFYSAITLEDKLGVEYEPYIFAALNSAKVMLVIGTKPEYFNAVWVKNEWARFLNLMKSDREKLLIPCYRDMDAYDLPEEFSHLQAQDMSKIGFINDIVRGIKKVLVKDEPAPTAVKETVVQTAGGTNTAPLLKRAFMFLEDGDWNSANEYCEKVLDIDPECAEAYLGKLMADLRCRKQTDLKNCQEPFDANNNYQKVLRFGDEKLKSTLAGYVDYIKERNENARKESIYTRAKSVMENAMTGDGFNEAAKQFESISDYKNSEALAKECYEKAEELRVAEEEQRLAEMKRQAEITRQLTEARARKRKRIACIGCSIVSVVVAFVILLNTVIIPTSNYNNAVKLMDAGSYEEAIVAFEAMDGYKDSAEKANSVYDKYKAEKLKTAKVGDYVFFGAYEQDNNTSNGKEYIKWLVLEVKDGKALIISKYALDCQPYNTSDTDVTWETCTLRKWLNNEFINSAFSAEEKAMIPAVTVSANKNPDYSTNPGNATQDRVFLFSITEANKYFSSDRARQCKPTVYAVAGGAYVNISNGNCRWWLRSPGFIQCRAVTVDLDGDVYEYGNFVSIADYAVRPALWIDLNS